MSVDVRSSSTGRIVIPGDACDALSLSPGATLRLSHHGERIVLEIPQQEGARISYAAFRERVPRYDGPPVPAGEMTGKIGGLFRGWRD